MKSVFKKLIITLCTMSVTITVAATVVSASMTPRSGPNDTSSVTDTVKESTTSDKTVSATTKTTTEPTNVTQQTTTQTAPAKKYLTKWGGFFWFLLSVIVNFILSCWISNRFYKLAKRNTQGSAEIRALRKDIEEKFASTLTDINEPAVEVINHNENYARTEDGMGMPERKQSVEIEEEGKEILGRWDMKRTSEKKESDDDARTYEMRRPSAPISFEGDDDEEVVSNKTNTGAKAANKAKDFLSNIFPFEE